MLDIDNFLGLYVLVRAILRGFFAFTLKRPSLNFCVEKWVKNTNNQIDKGIAEAFSVRV